MDAAVVVAETRAGQRGEGRADAGSRTSGAGRGDAPGRQHV